MCILFFFLQLLVFLTLSHSLNPSKPNVIFILGDDWGWNDFSFTGSTNIETPNIDLYKEDGIYLFRYYSLHLCTPARSSLLTGKYASRIGMQHSIWNPGYTKFNILLISKKKKLLTQGNNT